MRIAHCVLSPSPEKYGAGYLNSDGSADKRLVKDWEDKYHVDKVTVWFDWFDYHEGNAGSTIDFYFSFVLRQKVTRADGFSIFELQIPEFFDLRGSTVTNVKGSLLPRRDFMYYPGEMNKGRDVRGRGVVMT